MYHDACIINRDEKLLLTIINSSKIVTMTIYTVVSAVSRRLLDRHSYSSTGSEQVLPVTKVRGVYSDKQQAIDCCLAVVKQDWLSETAGNIAELEQKLDSCDSEIARLSSKRRQANSSTDSAVSDDEPVVPTDVELLVMAIAQRSQLLSWFNEFAVSPTILYPASMATVSRKQSRNVTGTMVTGWSGDLLNEGINPVTKGQLKNTSVPSPALSALDIDDSLVLSVLGIHNSHYCVFSSELDK